MVYIGFILTKALWDPLARKSRGVRIREALETLGPIFVKFGQVLSTRYDMLPKDIIDELIKLQDRVPPFPGLQAQRLVEKALGGEITQFFQTFETMPLASASISQVHKAILNNGKKVVVKILRPRIHVLIKRDIALLSAFAKLVNRYCKNIRIFKPRDIVAEFEKILLNELDLLREAANASQLKRNFFKSHLVYIPEIHWQLTKQSVLVMEYIEGISILNNQTLIQQGFNLKQLAKQIIEIFFTQVFRDCFFHADMHPGNILVSTKNPDAPTCILLDFGIMGSLSATDQHYLAENILAFLKRDYRRIATLHLESGWIPKTTRLDEFEAMIRTISEPMFEKSLKEISFGQLLLKLFQMAKHYHINIQPQLVLLQKTLMNVESLSRQLDPDIDLWSIAKPFLEKWMKHQLGLPALLRQIKAYSPHWVEKIPEIPNLLYAALKQLAKQTEPLA